MVNFLDKKLDTPYLRYLKFELCFNIFNIFKNNLQ